MDYYSSMNWQVSLSFSDYKLITFLRLTSSLFALLIITDLLIKLLVQCHTLYSFQSVSERQNEKAMKWEGDGEKMFKIWFTDEEQQNLKAWTMERRRIDTSFVTFFVTLLLSLFFLFHSFHPHHLSFSPQFSILADFFHWILQTIIFPQLLLLLSEMCDKQVASDLLENN